jgi:hypothetical protein
MPPRLDRAPSAVNVNLLNQEPSPKDSRVVQQAREAHDQETGIEHDDGYKDVDWPGFLAIHALLQLSTTGLAKASSRV